MKNTAKAVIAMVALGASAWIIIAQDTGNPPDDQRPPRRQIADGQGGPGGPGGPRMRAGRPPIPPVIRALDANHDGVIDADEIANAPAALKTLDKNGDGKLTMDELMPPPPQGMGGFPGDGQGPGDGPQPRRPHPNSGGNFDGPPGPPPGDQQ
jgi:EF hand